MKKYNIIPGNDKLLINLEGRVKNIYSKDRLDELVKFDGENIILDMYGQERKVDKKWLTLIWEKLRQEAKKNTGKMIIIGYQ